MENNNPAGNVQENQQPGVPTAEIHIRWVNGAVTMDAPENPLLVMKILGDALGVYAMEVQKRIVKENQSSIIVPNGAFVDKELMKKANQG